MQPICNTDGHASRAAARGAANRRRTRAPRRCAPTLLRNESRFIFPCPGPGARRFRRPETQAGTPFALAIGEKLQGEGIDAILPGVLIDDFAQLLLERS